MSMCWCKDCEWFYKEHCSNVKSDNCTEMMGDYNSCEHSKFKARNFVEESMREAVKMLTELYEIANKMEHSKASYALAEGIVALEDKNESKEKGKGNE